MTTLAQTRRCEWITPLVVEINQHPGVRPERDQKWMQVGHNSCSDSPESPKEWPQQKDAKWPEHVTEVL